MRFAIFWCALTFLLVLLSPLWSKAEPGLLQFYHVFGSFMIAQHYFRRIRDEGKWWFGVRTAFRTGTIWHKMGDIL